MAFDGLTIANIAYELNRELTGARLYKIAQPEDELREGMKTVDMNAEDEEETSDDEEDEEFDNASEAFSELLDEQDYDEMFGDDEEE